MNKSRKLLIEDLRINLGELFIKDGLTLDVITLSQELDQYILEEQLSINKDNL